MKKKEENLMKLDIVEHFEYLEKKLDSRIKLTLKHTEKKIL